MIGKNSSLINNGNTFWPIKGIYRVMKSLIRKILREQGEEINSQEDYDRIVNEKRIKRDVEMEKRIRIILKYIPKLDFNVLDWLDDVRESGQPNTYYRKTLNSQMNDIFKLIKLFSGKPPRYYGSLEIAVLIVETFIQNGGYKRNFDDGMMLDLTPITYYEISGELEELMKVWTNVDGRIYGANSPEEATQAFEMNPWSWTDDSEEQDRETLETVRFEPTNVVAQHLQWNPEMVGL
jgi:hypothetical protein